MSKNPFALVRAADFSDEQINDLWVELGRAEVEQIIEPRERLSKFILGGKGAGKTHLLRYHCYPVARLRNDGASGLQSVLADGYLAVFLRATGIDAARFKASSSVDGRWQQLFGIYLELRLGELVVEAVQDLVRSSSASTAFNVDSFLSALARETSGVERETFDSIGGLLEWMVEERKKIDVAVNNSAFSGRLDVNAKFSLGGMSIGLGRALPLLHADLRDLPLLYLIDEVENFSAEQQVVVNTLIRYAEGNASFRISGRLYSMKTQATMGGGEENREGAEFKTTNLDEIMRGWTGYSKFAERFIQKRIGIAGDTTGVLVSELDVSSFFEEIDRSDNYRVAVARFADGQHGVQPSDRFRAMLQDVPALRPVSAALLSPMAQDFPAVIQKLNFLKFCKRAKRGIKPAVAIELAAELGRMAREYLEGETDPKKGYGNAYGHWASDLFAQICKESGRSQRVLYAGFPTFVKMSCHNPRNLLIVLARAYAIAQFRGVDLLAGEKLSVELQTTAVTEAANFMYESDSNFGSPSENARQATSRLANLLRTARFSLSIPEVSPLAVSFSDGDLSLNARAELLRALSYSFVYEVSDGRPDRNSHRLNRKIRLNPLIAPKWELPVSTRGDIALSAELINSIFDPEQASNFEGLLNGLRLKWSHPLGRASSSDLGGLFQ